MTRGHVLLRSGRRRHGTCCQCVLKAHMEGVALSCFHQAAVLIMRFSTCIDLSRVSTSSFRESECRDQSPPRGRLEGCESQLCPNRCPEVVAGRKVARGTLGLKGLACPSRVTASADCFCGPFSARQRADDLAGCPILPLL